MVVRLAVCAMPGRGHAAMPATKEMNTRRFMLASSSQAYPTLTCPPSGTRDAAESHVLRALSAGAAACARDPVRRPRAAPACARRRHGHRGEGAERAAVRELAIA